MNDLTVKFLKVRDKLQSQSLLPDDNEMSKRLIWACFLIQEGASTEMKNKNGKSALQSCPTQHAKTIMQFKQKKGYVQLFAGFKCNCLDMNMSIKMS